MQKTPGQKISQGRKKSRSRFLNGTGLFGCFNNNNNTCSNSNNRMHRNSNTSSSKGRRHGKHQVLYNPSEILLWQH